MGESTAALVKSVIDDACYDDVESTASGGMSEPLSLPPSPTEVELAPPSACTLADLPSIGSIGHFAGQCSRCCFFPKGRCENGYNCRFCHFEHEKRQRKKKTVIAGRG